MKHENYAGMEISTAQRHSPGGLAYPHVELNCMDSKHLYSAYFRGRFNEGRGVVPFHGERHFYSREEFENPRGWEDITVICENRSPEEARDLAIAEAKKRKVVLFEAGLEGGKFVERITWHPEGWEPTYVGVNKSAGKIVK